ncbi:hypothetical protein E2C01_084926 [Portunus trituberculatus]|uniref:Uncharacterized protein n=1 Tax=Portunus trituberculatus TaxID=210409 RepID=A0A5B7IWM1_PORTR|nr:hypothetical protein [Portunus trituberculatus]
MDRYRCAATVNVPWRRSLLLPALQGVRDDAQVAAVHHTGMPPGQRTKPAVQGHRRTHDVTRGVYNNL